VLMDVSGHLCVVTNECGHRKALWFLMLDHKWEQRYLIGKTRDIDNYEYDFYRGLVLGVWDCLGVLVLHLQTASIKLCLYHVETKKMFMVNLPQGWRRTHQAMNGLGLLGLQADPLCHRGALSASSMRACSFPWDSIRPE
jgi:hypothetical protein